ncbi:MAG: SRPBCC domain-containing protein [Actinobacteria bacterium]|nr:SRPBCC domain-containing protein [Actinomycetota bacterium]
MVRRWWAGNRGQVTSIEIDLRVGGRWRYAMVADDGSEVAFHGEYREVIPGERIVFTEVSEARPAAEALTTVTFRDAGAGTAVAILVRYGSRLDRDTHYDHMQDGLQDALGLLEQTVSSLRNGQAPAAGRP